MVPSISLNDLKIQANKTYETIVTTVNSNGKSNAATIGIQRVPDDKLQLKIYDGSNTFKNLKRNVNFGINIIDTSQYEHAIIAALNGWGNLEPEFELEEYEVVDNIPFLKFAKCHIICKIDSHNIYDITDKYGSNKLLELKASIKKLIIQDIIEEPLIRNKNLPLLEAAILATRFKVSTGEVKEDCKSRINQFIDSAIAQHQTEKVERIITLIEQFIKQCD